MDLITYDTKCVQQCGCAVPNTQPPFSQRFRQPVLRRLDSIDTGVPIGENAHSDTWAFMID